LKSNHNVDTVDHSAQTAILFLEDLFKRNILSFVFFFFTNQM